MLFKYPSVIKQSTSLLGTLTITLRGFIPMVSSIFNKGIMTSTEVIDIGGDNVDYDLSYIYKINRRDSLYLKEVGGSHI